MMEGFLPPSSKDNFLNIGAAIEAICAPALVLPVNEIALIEGCFTIASPQFGPSPCMMFKTPSGSPAAAEILASK